MSATPVKAPPAPDYAPQVRHLYGKWIDALLLGGGSLLVIPLLAWWVGEDPDRLVLSMGYSLLLANLINHPHFAHSYQIFYAGYYTKITKYSAPLRWRYALSGILVPGLLAISLALPVAHGVSPSDLGLAVNIMFFFVGWHYVKQGYGMAMVDAVLKRAFFSEGEKKALLMNAYAVWIFSWLIANASIPGDKAYWGIPYTSLPVPSFLVWAGGLAACISTLQVIRHLSTRVARGEPVGWTGVLAYSVSCYVWLLVRHPVLLIWAPLFHSLQYLAVVWRFRINKIRAESGSIRPSLRHGVFLVAGIALGYFGFATIPGTLNELIQYNNTVYGPTLFLFAFWIFINVHHYFMDSVMWRKGNPDVQKHLFSH